MKDELRIEVPDGMKLGKPIRRKTNRSETIVVTINKDTNIVVVTPEPPPPPPSEPVITDSIFASTSFWYAPIPAKASLHEHTTEFTQEFLRQMKANYGHVAANTESYACPVYVVGPEVPTVVVTADPYVYSRLQSQWLAVPIPAYAMPAPGTDQEMTIYQPSTDTIWEFYKTGRYENGDWYARWGGRMDNVSTSDGIWTAPFGATATGLPFLGGQVTAEELRRGEIRHVIGMAIVNPADYRSWPALRSDGSNRNGMDFPIPEGMRFRLDPAINIDALNIHPVAKTIAGAGQKYGFVVWDGSGVIAIRLQSSVGYVAEGKIDPYYGDLFGDAKSYNVFDGVPWEALQFLPMDYGKPS